MDDVLMDGDEMEESNEEVSDELTHNEKFCNYGERTKCYLDADKNGRCYCHPIEGPHVAPFNDVCPVCLDDKDTDLLRCRHQIHTKCLSMCNKKECPVCKDDVSYLPKKVIKQIEKNTARHILEQEEQERENIREMLEAEEEQGGYSPEAEIITALNYLVSIGIPHNILNNLNIDLGGIEPYPPPVGFLFRGIINEALRVVAESLDADGDEDTMQLSSDEHDNGSEEEDMEIVDQWIARGDDFQSARDDNPPIITVIGNNNGLPNLSMVIGRLLAPRGRGNMDLIHMPDPFSESEDEPE
jgi:hypothetical protein